MEVVGAAVAALGAPSAEESVGLALVVGVAAAAQPEAQLLRVRSTHRAGREQRLATAPPSPSPVQGASQRQAPLSG